MWTSVFIYLFQKSWNEMCLIWVWEDWLPFKNSLLTGSLLEWRIVLKGFLLKIETKYRMFGVHGSQTLTCEEVVMLMPVFKLGFEKLEESMDWRENNWASDRLRFSPQNCLLTLWGKACHLTFLNINFFQTPCSWLKNQVRQYMQKI